MVISEIEIVKFRAFGKQSIKIGKYLTVICGMNGTQKTTLLGMLSQPFTITSGPLYGEKTIDGYNFRSQFKEKFKLSNKHDKPGQHSWTLRFFNYSFYNGKNYISIVSSARKVNGKTKGIRFINAEGKSKGKGYVQVPVVYLSLSRLFPIGESGEIKSFNIDLAPEEEELYIKLYKEILSIQCSSESKPAAKRKDSKRVFAGVTDSNHDIESNSAGESNVGRIILSILSFNRLLKKHNTNYKAGILLIDELDATLFGFAQKKIIHVFSRLAKEFKIQIIFTTHSQNIVSEIWKLQKNEVKKIKDNSIINKYKFENEIIYLKNEYTNSNKQIKSENVHNPTDYKRIIHQMDLINTPANNSINLYLEDRRAIDFLNILLKIMGIDINKYVKIINVNLSWTNYYTLLKHCIPEFLNSLIILDRDVLLQKNEEEKINFFKKQSNVIFMPLTIEKDLFKFLKDSNTFKMFSDKLKNYNVANIDYNVCFSDWTEDVYDSNEYKKWFSKLSDGINQNLEQLYSFWFDKNQDSANEFKNEIVTKYNLLAKNNDYEIIM